MPDCDKFLVDGQPPGFMMGDHALTLELGLVGEEYEKLAALELRETPQVVHEAVRQLKDLLRAEKDLYLPLEDEGLLIMFLRPCKFYPHSAFERIKKYFRFSEKNPQLSAHLTPSHDQAVFQQDMMSVLPKRDQYGRRILLLEVGRKWQTDVVSANDIHRAVWLTMEVAALEPRTQIAGAVVILDIQGLAMKHVWQISPAFAYNLATWVQECIPTRLKAVHIVRQPYIFNMLYAIFKPFLQEKLRKRIHFHGTDWHSLHQHVSPSCLPRQFGGHLDIPDKTSIKLHQTLCIFEAEFEEYTKYGYKKLAMEAT